MIIRNPFKGELPHILDLLNEEFILRKGKKLHISRRYPLLYNQPKSLWGLYDEKELLAFLAVKEVEVYIKDKCWNLFFVGSVFTPRKHRKNGYANILLSSVQKDYLNNNYDAGVLWTNLHAYYEKIGWLLHENGLLFTCSKVKSSLFENLFENIEVESIQDYSEIDKFRIFSSKNYLLRKKGKNFFGYGTIYSPGEVSFGIKIIKGSYLIGYSLGVVSNNTVIFYEIAGDMETVLISSLAYFLKANKHYVFKFNMEKETTSMVLLNKYFHEVRTEYPSITMYLCKNDRVLQQVMQLYIPFTDRI
jgi:hypothetical protein